MAQQGQYSFYKKKWYLTNFQELSTEQLRKGNSANREMLDFHIVLKKGSYRKEGTIMIKAWRKRHHPGEWTLNPPSLHRKQAGTAYSVMNTVGQFSGSSDVTKK